MSTVFPFSRPSTQPSPSPPMGIQPCTGTPPLRSQSHNLFHLFQHKLILLFHLLLLILCYISAKSRALLVEFLSSILYSTCVCTYTVQQGGVIFKNKMLHFVCCAKWLQDLNSRISCLNVAWLFTWRPGAGLQKKNYLLFHFQRA